MEIVETLQLAIGRITPTAFLMTIAFGLIVGFVFVGRFGMSLKQMVLSTILTFLLLIMLTIDATLNGIYIRPDNPDRATNGVAALLLYMLFVACASVGAKTEAELNRDKREEAEEVLKEEAASRAILRNEAKEDSREERETIRQENRFHRD